MCGGMDIQARRTGLSVLWLSSKSLLV